MFPRYISNICHRSFIKQFDIALKLNLNRGFGRGGVSPFEIGDQKRLHALVRGEVSPTPDFLHETPHMQKLIERYAHPPMKTLQRPRPIGADLPTEIKLSIPPQSPRANARNLKKSQSPNEFFCD